jgi:hypothetical protein
MEFGLIALLLGAAYIVHGILHRPRPALEVALEHLERGASVRAECVAEQALRTAKREPRSLAAGKAGVDFAQILIGVGDGRRARSVLAEAVEVLRAHGADLSRAEALQASLTDEAPAEVDGEWRFASGSEVLPPTAPAVLAAAAPVAAKVADRCPSTGGCGCGPAGVVEPEASSAFAELLSGGRAAGLIGAAEIRREGDNFTPRITVTGDLSAEEERVVERAVRGAMGVLFGA